MHRILGLAAPLLPQESLPDEPKIVALATRVRDELARTLKITAPPRVTLRFHPTIESYQRATGRQWFTAGATTTNGEAHFIPLTLLKERDIVDETIRHELVHVLTASALKGRPVWVHEGAAMYFSVPHANLGQAEQVGQAIVPGAASGSTSDASCPADSELLRPASREALRTAYRRAAACFAGQLAAGRSWREVR